MPVRFLTDADRERLSQFPPEIPDLYTYFALSAADLAQVQTQRGDHQQLGFAVQLGTLRYLGFCPDDLITDPAALVQYVAQQLGVDPAASDCGVGQLPAPATAQQILGWRHPLVVRWATLSRRGAQSARGCLAALLWVWKRADHAELDIGPARPIRSKVVPSTVQDSTYVLDAILDNETDLPIVEHATDTAGIVHTGWGCSDMGQLLIRNMQLVNGAIVAHGSQRMYALQGFANSILKQAVSVPVLCMTAVLEQLQREGYPLHESDLEHLSPARYEHINSYGKYHFTMKEELNRVGLRPLRSPEAVSN